MATTSTDILKTGLLGKLCLDQGQLDDALGAIDDMSSNEAYSAYSLIVDPRKPGGWTQIVLGNWSGNASDGRSMEYDGHFLWTEEGAKVPFIRELIESNFHCKHLKSIRVFSAENAMIVSHRDYMEFKKGFWRFHIPLRTNESCMNSEGALVYHMNVGGIYFLDGRVAHSGGNLASGESRVHLVLDFDPDISVSDLFMPLHPDQTWETMEWIARPVLNESQIDRIVEGLAVIASSATYPAIMLAANMLPFVYQFDVSAVYDVIVEAAVRCGKPDLVARALADRTYFLGIQ
jgi:Aspartyl/Asparaginyl beta-hydroxylase